MGANRISQSGVLEIAEHEGIVLGPYVDSVGVPTYGVGHTAAAGGLKPALMEQVDTRGWSDMRARQETLTALKVFDEDLDKYEDRVRNAITVSLSQHEFDALVSFDFNTGGIFRAKLRHAINGSEDGASRHFFGWLRPPEIRKRREAEELLFRTGDYDANGDAIPIYDSLGDGRIRRRTTISGRELAALMKEAGAKHEPARTKAKKPTFNLGQFLLELIEQLFGRKA